MKRDLILAGVGGQGLLALAGVIGEAARALGLHLLQSEVHGMAQRGGVVQSHLRYSDLPIHSALVREGTADLILSLEPMEALRYLPYLRPEGALVTNADPFKNSPGYPDESVVREAIERLPRHRMIPAGQLAKEAGALQATNMVMLGAGAPYLDLSLDALREAIRNTFASKPDRVIQVNLRAFQLGLDASRAADA